MFDKARIEQMLANLQALPEDEALYPFFITSKREGAALLRAHLALLAIVGGLAAQRFPSALNAGTDVEFVYCPHCYGQPVSGHDRLNPERIKHKETCLWVEARQLITGG